MMAVAASVTETTVTESTMSETTVTESTMTESTMTKATIEVAVMRPMVFVKRPVGMAIVGWVITVRAASVIPAVSVAARMNDFRRQWLRRSAKACE